MTIPAHRIHADSPAFTDALGDGWENWSWASTHPVTSPVHGGTTALEIDAGAWQAAFFHHPGLGGAGYTSITLWIHGGPTGGQSLVVQSTIGGTGIGGTNLPPLTANTWQRFNIPLTSLGVDASTPFDGFWVQDRTGTKQPTFYLDDLALISGAAPPPVTNAPVVITVDAALDRHSISPLIYGVAYATTAQLADLNAPINRSGGNGESRYNWKLNAHNHAADWYFESLPEDSATPGAAADDFVASTRAGGSNPMLTIPLMGWAPKLGPNRGRLSSYSIARYGAQTGSDSQWFPDAGNGIRATDGKRITWNDPNDANLPVDVAFQRGWVEHLTTRWGRAVQGGVPYFFMDNEPSIWHSTHQDIHPSGAGMEEVRDKFLAGAGMIKAMDPDALVAGPEEWGWLGYLYSGLDQQAAATNGWSKLPDRIAHGGWDYLPWLLDQLRRDAATNHRRLLDVFTVHYYPQGGEYSSDTSTAMQSRRNRSTRSLWDPDYTDESWIQSKVQLLPRLKNWVATHYPGTRIGLTEYNWGAEGHISGALAQADVLGILGREGIDMATRWTTPATGTPAYLAMKIYRNYDGAKSTFGDVSVRAAGSNPDELATFAAERSSDHTLTVLLVHKRQAGATPLQLDLTNFAAAGTVHRWQLSANNPIQQLEDSPLQNGRWAAELPAQSLTLLIIPRQSPAHLTLGTVRPDGSITLNLEGIPNLHYRIEKSPDLIHWSAIQTNSATTTPIPLVLPAATNHQLFLRALSLP